MEDKLKDQEKELERLVRRNKILTKRNIKLKEDCKKLEEENLKLVDEIDKYEALDINLEADDSICPECGHDVIIYTKPDGSSLKRCSEFPICKYKG